MSASTVSIRFLVSVPYLIMFRVLSQKANNAQTTMVNSKTYLNLAVIFSADLKLGTVADSKTKFSRSLFVSFCKIF